MRTGQQYKESLADGRLTYFEGKQIDDLETHPILGQTVDATAAGYDRFYDPAPNATSPLMTVPRSADDLREMIPVLHTAGMMAHVTYTSIQTLKTAAGRMTDSKPEYIERIDHFIDEAQRDDMRITQCITDAKGDRRRPPARQDDLDSYVRVVDRQRDGVVIRGAKLHTTGASFGHELLTIPTKAMKAGEEDWSIGCSVAGECPGRKDHQHHVRTAPRRHPFLPRVGLAQLVAEANGTAGIGHVKEKISEMIIHATLIRATLEAAIEHCSIGPEGAAFPNELYTNAGKFHAAANYSAVVRHLHDIAGGAVLTSPVPADFENPDVGPLARKYMSTRHDVDGEYRARLMHTIRGLTADSYGGWKFVTNLQAGGGLYAQRIVTRRHYDLDGAKRKALAVAGLAEPAH